MKSKEITTISTVSIVGATVVLVGLMVLGYKIVSKKINKEMKNNDNFERNTLAKQSPAPPITSGNQERLLSANTKENEKKIKNGN